MAYINTNHLVGEAKKNRYRLMLAIYKLTEGDTQTWLAADEVAQQLNMPTPDFEKAFRYLIAEELLAMYGAGYTCYLTHKGCKAIEAAQMNPTRETEHFAPANNIPPATGRIA